MGARTTVTTTASCGQKSVRRAGRMFAERSNCGSHHDAATAAALQRFFGVAADGPLRSTHPIPELWDQIFVHMFSFFFHNHQLFNKLCKSCVRSGCMMLDLLQVFLTHG